MGNWTQPAGSPCWPNACIDILSIENSQKSSAEGSSGPGIAGLRAQANSHNLGGSQETHSWRKAAPNSTDGSYLSSYCRKLPSQSSKEYIQAITKVSFGLLPLLPGPGLPVSTLPSTWLRGHLRGGGGTSVPSYPLHSLGLKVQFRPTESLSRKRLAVHVVLFMHQERIEKQAESNFPYLKAPYSLWSSSNRILPLASRLTGPPSR